MKTNGVLYLNVGKKMLTRLYVSIYTLKQHCSDINVCIAHYDSDETEMKLYKKIKKDFKNITIKNIKNEVQEHIKKNKLKPIEGRKWVLLLKTLAHVYTPFFNNTVFIDSDTIILNNKIYDIMLDVPYDFGVTRFSDWTTKQRKIKKRIEGCKGLISDIFIHDALQYKEAINLGVFAFKKNSEFMENLYEYAEKIRSTFIPDEVACQIMLAQFDHYIMPSTFNTSCRYDTIDKYTNIIHFHGRKHCRFDKDNNPIFNCELWLDEFIKVEKELTHYNKLDRFLTLNADNIKEYKKCQKK